MNGVGMSVESKNNLLVISGELSGSDINSFPFIYISPNINKSERRRTMHKRTTMQEYAPNFAMIAQKKRVCAYARVSGDRDEAFHSLSAQVSYYQKIIADHPDWEFVEVFSDRGITGTKENREGFQAMLTACREGKVDIVLAKSITRFARNTVILLETIRELKRYGISVHFEEEHIDTLSSKGELMISILAARAQEESRSASENQLWRIKKSYEKGIPVTGNCLGYRMVDHQFLIDEEEEQLVLRIFSMYLSGKGFTTIAKTLSNEGIKTPTGLDKWSAQTVRNILMNEKYCGDLVLQKKYHSDYLSKKTLVNKGEKPKYKVTDAHDPIIDRDTFIATQNEIRRRDNEYGPKKPRQHYLFSGLIKCGKCHNQYLHIISAPHTKYEKPNWICGCAREYGKTGCDSTWRIPEAILIQKTCEALEANDFDEAFLRESIEEIVAISKSELAFHFKDGRVKIIEWHHRSRRESWTPEMKEKARQKALAINEARQKERREKNGS